MAAQADADDSFSQMSTKALKRMLEGLGVSTATCCERGDLLKLAEGNPGAADEGVDALYALSDPHSGDRTNMRYLSSLPARPRSALIVAGDVDDDVRVLTETLRVCVSKFGGGVFFTPGNHDLWLLGRERDSLAKLDVVLKAAEAAGASTTRRLLRGRGGERSVLVIPLLSWHHASFDTEPALTCWGGLPTARQAMSDYHNCAWPAPLDDATESVARHFDALNDDAPVDVDRATTAVVTFSHFLPRIELIPEKRFMFLPCLAECVGSRFLGDRVARLRPDVHVFGHTHLAWDATLDGVRYLQGCVGYPNEWATRPASLEIGRLRCCPVAPDGRGRACELVRDGPLKVWDAAAGLAGYFGAKWSKHYETYPRRPDVTHVLPPYSAARYAPLAGSEVRDVCDHVPPFGT